MSNVVIGTNKKKLLDTSVKLFISCGQVPMCVGLLYFMVCTSEAYANLRISHQRCLIQTGSNEKTRYCSSCLTCDVNYIPPTGIFLHITFLAITRFLFFFYYSHKLHKLLLQEMDYILNFREYCNLMALQIMIDC